MSTRYVRLEQPENASQISKDGLIKSSLKKALINVLTKVIPKANPDFEDRIDDVKYWLVEVDNDTGIPQREIGFDEKDEVIMIMPYKDNYGFWTDSNVLLTDNTEHFSTSEIGKENFERYWETFDKRSELK